MLSIDRADSYDPIQTLREERGLRVLLVQERSLGTEGVLYRLDYRGVDPGTVNSRLESIVQPYAAIHHPRLPIMVDAWISDATFEFVLVQPRCAPVTMVGAGNPLADASEAVRWSFALATLDALRALHEFENVHGALTDSSYGIDAFGFVRMTDPSLLRRFQDALSREVAEMGGQISLSVNVKSRDVADWANMFASLLLRQRAVQSAFDDWDSAEIEGASRKLATLYQTRSPKHDFLLKCLRGHTFEGGGFNSALEAFAAAETIAKAERGGGGFA